MWQQPKTDWTSVDVYLATDLNRVEQNTQYMRDEIVASGYAVPELIYKTDWKQEDILFNDDFNRIEGNIKTIADVYFTGADWEEMKTDWVPMDSVGYAFANRVERNLKILYDILMSMRRQYVRLGVCRAGQARLWQHRWR